MTQIMEQPGWSKKAIKEGIENNKRRLEKLRTDPKDEVCGVHDGLVHSQECSCHRNICVHCHGFFSWVNESCIRCGSGYNLFAFN